jgi:hypothetical protein
MDDALEAGAALLAADLVATLGWTSTIAADIAQREFTSAESNVSFYVDDDGAARVSTTILRAVEETQQWLHDTFLDTTWPACPEHPNHPLWLDENTPPAWCCPTTGTRVALLGSLAVVATPPSREAVAVNRAAIEENNARTAKLMKQFGKFIRTR